MNNEDARYVLILDSGTWYESNDLSNDFEYLKRQAAYAMCEGRAAVIYDKETDEHIYV